MDARMIYGRTLRRFLHDERAGTAIEYALIAVGVAAVIVTAVTALGEAVLSLFLRVLTALQG